MNKTQKDSTALLVMDIQTSFISRLGENGETTIKAIQTAIAAARTAGIPVIYVVVGFRKGFPEISANNQSFSYVKANSATFPGLEEPIEIFPAIAPQPGDVVMTKRRVSAFTGSDLEVVLRGFTIKHLVLSGFSTSGVVLSTVREAADKDFQLSVLSDCCADPESDVHTLLLSKVFPRQAEVLTAEEWVTRIK